MVTFCSAGISYLTKTAFWDYIIFMFSIAKLTQTKKNHKTLIALWLIGFFLFSSCVIHVVHKHCPFKGEFACNYDASCQWVKTDKAGKSAFSPSSLVFVLAFYLSWVPLFVVGSPLAAREEIIKKLLLPTALAPRAPPAPIFF